MKTLESHRRPFRMSARGLSSYLSLAALILPLVGSQTPPPANVLVVFHSKTNRTQQLATAVADGARHRGANVRLKSISDTNVEADVLKWADAIILGSPVHYGNVAAAVLSWFETAWEPLWTDPRFDGKLGAVFASGGGLAQGLEHVNSSLQRLLASFRIQCLTPAPTRSGYDSYGAVAVTGTAPFDGPMIADPFVQAGQALGALVAGSARHI